MSGGAVARASRRARRRSRRATPLSGKPLRLSVSGLRLAAKRWGTPGGPRVLALHGWLDNAASFDALARLAPELDLVAVDLPGHGLSQHRPFGVAYHFVDWVADVVGIAEALGWERSSIIGHSMGAGIGALYAGALPERVERLVLLEGLGPSSGTPEAAPERVASALRDRQRAAAREPLPYRTLEQAAAHFGRVAGHRDPRTTELIVRRGARKVDGGYAWRADPRLRGSWPVRLTEEQVRAFLVRIACPTMLIWASDGYPWDRAEMQGRAALVPRLSVHELGGGHHVHADEPEVVARLVRPFFGLDG